MKYQIGGTFSHRHSGFTEITDVRVSIPGSGMSTLYYFDDDLEDSCGHTEEELDKWVKEGWHYGSPEYWKKLEDERLQEQAKHQYPKR